MSEFVEVSGVKITSPNKILFPSSKITKLDVARYYEKISDKILPYLSDRPVTIVRAPEGISKGIFYQRHPSESFPSYIERVLIKEKKGTVGAYIVLDSLQDIIYLVNIGVLEFHIWGAKVDDLEKPDQMVFDLDPGEGVSFEDLKKACVSLKKILEENKLKSFIKTSGKHGYHIIVPLKPKLNWEETKNLAKAIAVDACEDLPNLFTLELSKSKRKGKIFIDYLRNHKSATNVCVYSTRAYKDCTISMPFSWELFEKDNGKNVPRPDFFLIKNT